MNLSEKMREAAFTITTNASRLGTNEFALIDGKPFPVNASDVMVPLATALAILTEAERIQDRDYLCLEHIGIAITEEEACIACWEKEQGALPVDGLAEVEDAGRQPIVDECLKELHDDLRNNRNDRATGEVLGAINALVRVGLLPQIQAAIWAKAIQFCPGHDDEGGRQWCAYCGDLPAPPQPTE